MFKLNLVIDHAPKRHSSVLSGAASSVLFVRRRFGEASFAYSTFGDVFCVAVGVVFGVVVGEALVFGVTFGAAFGARLPRI